jgi:hypothetical protein
MSSSAKAAASGWAQGTGTTSAVLVIPPGDEPTTLVVLDNILASTINGTAANPYTVSVKGTIIARKTVATTVADFLDMDFPGGYPVWNTSGTDDLPYRYPNLHDPSINDSFYPIYGGVAGAGELNQGAGMSFTTGTAGYTIYGISFPMERVGNPTDSLQITLRTVSITGSVVATSALVSAGWGGPAEQTIYFKFTTPFLTVLGTKYFIQILRSPTTRNTINFVRARATTGSVLASAGSYSLDSTTWSGESATDDTLFKAVAGVDMILAAPASSTGSALTVTYHYARPAHVRN